MSGRGMPSALRVAAAAIALCACAADVRAGPEPEKKAPPTRWAILIACQDYADTARFPAPRFTRKEMTEFKACLVQTGFDADRVIIMHENQPDELQPKAANIRAQLSNLLRGDRINEQDLVLVAFSGHGIQIARNGKPASYLCPIDANPADEAKLIPVQLLLDCLKECKARRQMLFLDAARPFNPAITGKGVMGKVEPLRWSEDFVPKDGRLAVLVSCENGKTSIEDPGHQRGVFFHHVMTGWSKSAWDSSGRLTVGGLFKHVRERSIVTAESLSGEQKPVYFGTETWELWNGGFGEIKSDIKISSLALSRDGALALLGGKVDSGGMLAVWDMQSSPRKKLGELEVDSRITSVAVSPDGKLALCGGYDKTIRLVEFPSLKEKRRFGSEKAWVHSVAFRIDQQAEKKLRILAGDSSGDILLFDADAANEKQPLWQAKAHKGGTKTLAVFPDGKRFVSAGEDGNVRIWEADLKPGLLINAGKTPVHAVAISPDGKRLLTGSDRVRLWDAESGKMLGDFAAHDGTVFSVAFARNGQLGVSAGADGSVRTWNLEKGKPLCCFRREDGCAGHGGCVLAIAVTSDGKLLLSGSVDTTVRLWELGEE